MNVTGTKIKKNLKKKRIFEKSVASLLRSESKIYTDTIEIAVTNKIFFIVKV